MKKSEGDKAIAVVAATGVAAGGAALASGASPAASAALAAGSSLLHALVEPAQAFLLARARRRWEKLLQEYVVGSAEDPELVEARLQAEAEDPVVQELVVETARTMGEALTDSVVPPLARLLREYRSARRKADSFFRGVRRLLSDLDEEEFSSLRQLFVLVGALDVTNAQPSVELQYLPVESGARRVAPGQARRLSYLRPRTEEEQKQKPGPLNARVEIEQDPPHLLRLFQLLKVNGLAHDARSGGVGVVSGPEVMVVASDAVRRIRDLLVPA
jgi:hypothetical protein